MEQPYADYPGRTRRINETIGPYPVRAMRALLDLPPLASATGDTLPPLWHWLYFLEPARQSQLGSDGHPERGNFLPPVPLPRRMWAAGELSFRQPLRIGHTVNRQSTIRRIEHKQGRSGALTFVHLSHEYRSDYTLLMEEQQTLVFRAAQEAGAQIPVVHEVPPDADFSRPFVADATLLFRYSALTFNAHRIHFDRDYARDEEHYPDLVVHGPLLATKMIQLLQEARPGLRLASFRFRALAPAFAQRPMTIAGRALAAGQWHLWVADANGGLCMDATAMEKGAPV